MAGNELTTFISLFHSAEGAEEALHALEAAGFNRAAITSTWKGSEPADDHDSDAAGAPDYAAELTRIGVPKRDLDHLKSGLENGGVVISLEAAENRSDEIERIFHRYSSNKIDETDIDRNDIAAEPFVAPARAATSADSAVVPVVEEDLLVGKQAVDRGGVRVFRRTVEEPVSEQLNLHEEHVVFERRAVDRAVTDADMTAAGGTIELNETDEVPVVSKVARVVEEVRVGLVGSDHTETVRDTVRHTEIEVEPVDENDRAAASRASTRSI